MKVIWISYTLAKHGFSLTSLTATSTSLGTMLLGLIRGMVVARASLSKTNTSKELTRNIARPNGAEDVWLNIQCRMLPSVIVGCIYHHSKTPEETFDYKNETLMDMCHRNKNLYVLGDVNDDLSRGNKVNAILSSNKLHKGRLGEAVAEWVNALGRRASGA